MPVDADLRRRVDRWIRENGLNRYGDPAGTIYTGGTPLFNERTGQQLDRYEFILARHPELLSDPGAKSFG